MHYSMNNRLIIMLVLLLVHSPAHAEELRASRVVVVLAGLVAVVLAYVAQDQVFWLVLFAWGGLGAAIGPDYQMGIGAALARRGPRDATPGFLRFLAVYTVLMTLVYSAIPRKTPWNMLSFLHGWILMAGVGGATLLRMARPAAAKACVGVSVVSLVPPSPKLHNQV